MWNGSGRELGHAGQSICHRQGSLLYTTSKFNQLIFILLEVLVAEEWSIREREVVGADSRLLAHGWIGSSHPAFANLVPLGIKPVCDFGSLVDETTICRSGSLCF